MSDLEQDINNYINEIISTGIQTLQGKKINFINIEKTKGFQHIHAVGQIEEENAHKKAYICFGRIMPLWSKHKLNMLYLNLEKVLMKIVF